MIVPVMPCFKGALILVHRDRTLAQSEQVENGRNPGVQELDPQSSPGHHSHLSPSVA